MTTIQGTLGDDLLDGTASADIVLARAGSDQVNGLGGDDLIGLDVGDDTASGGDGADAIYGGDGKDVVNGDAGDDVLSGGAGNDRLSGGDGNDNLGGRDGDDDLRGGLGNDHLTGAGGDDYLDGGGGTNSLFGQDGNDTMFVASADYVNAGAGDDLVQLYGFPTLDSSIFLGDGNDRVTLDDDGEGPAFEGGGTATIHDFGHGSDTLGPFTFAITSDDDTVIVDFAALDSNTDQRIDPAGCGRDPAAGRAGNRPGTCPDRTGLSGPAGVRGDQPDCSEAGGPGPVDRQRLRCLIAHRRSGAESDQMAPVAGTAPADIVSPTAGRVKSSRISSMVVAATTY